MAVALTVCSTKSHSLGTKISENKKSESNETTVSENVSVDYEVTSESIEISNESLYSNNSVSIDEEVNSSSNDPGDRKGPVIDEPEPIFICDYNNICEE